jgi:hypothetical protein
MPKKKRETNMGKRRKKEKRKEESQLYVEIKANYELKWA